MWKVSWPYEKVHNFFGCAAILIWDTNSSHNF